MCLQEIKVDKQYKIRGKHWLVLKSFLVSGLVEEYRIKTNIFALSPNSAVKVFQQKYPEAKDVYVIQNLFKRKS